jgi:LacI family transcriptional regulator
MKKPSLKDIAKITGVSPTTVSRVLNGKAKAYRISLQTNELVVQTASEIGYIPNQTARGLRLKKSHTIGLILPNITNPFFSRIACAIENAARSSGFSIILTDSQHDQNLEIESIRMLMSRNVDGLIVLPMGQDENHLILVVESGIPLVIADRYFPDLNCPQVISDNYQGAFNATEHLIDNNHKNIACIQGRQNTSVNNERLKGYKDAMEKHQLKVESTFIVGDDFGTKNGYVSMKILQSNHPRPTAIFAFSNLIALGALKAMRENNMEFPHDISMVSFDNDQPLLEYLATPITTVAQQTDEIGQIAFKLLMTLVNNNEEKTDVFDKEPKIVTLPTKIIKRESVTRPKSTLSKSHIQ